MGISEADLLTKRIRVIHNEPGPADLVVVLNYAQGFNLVKAPKSRIIKVLQEPEIRNPMSHLFTFNHPRLFSRVYCHNARSSEPREIRSHCFLGSEIPPDEVITPGSRKTQTLSIIASSLQMLPGHASRAKFVDELILARPELSQHLFGRGRPKELIFKVEALEDYMYSVAIENDSSVAYITEKFTDCILAGTVPLYFGAPDVSAYFPEGSFVWLPIDDLEACLGIIDGLGPQDYESRLPALGEAQKRIREELSLGSLVERELETKIPEPADTRLVLLPFIDDILVKFWGWLVRVFSFVPPGVRRTLWLAVSRATGWRISR